MPSAYSQFRWRCIQKIIAGLAIGLAGIVLIFAEISFGMMTIPASPVFGVAIAVAGMLLALFAALSLRDRKKPPVRS